MGFFKKTWVEIVAIVMFVVSIILLALGGFAKADVAPIFEAVFAVLDVIVTCANFVLIAFNLSNASA